ncbi:hypothetical protein BES34_013480 [Leptospira inadai serovar Lyme]|uniref:Homing endonuclease LAGLIDADG domain-containing protein n=1 Tax=Leptospira inadai serovar Lyme TaxID=293084 RepID=A0ABX4YGZ6_9LEPT|nr:hypothetical protein BES34_013480 [Leptospira inadai serovar Lyme]
MVIEIPSEIDSFLSALGGVLGTKSIPLRSQNRTRRESKGRVWKFLVFMQDRKFEFRIGQVFAEIPVNFLPPNRRNFR